MRDARQTLEQYFLEMRWRCLSLAADLDRIERAAGGVALLDSDVRLQKLKQAVRVLRLHPVVLLHGRSLGLGGHWARTGEAGEYSLVKIR